MKIEIVEFYPFETQNKDSLSGTLHIILLDEGKHLRGIRVIQKKGKFKFFIPTKWGYDSKQKKMIRYPVTNYILKRHDKELLAEIEKLGKIYIESKMKA
jgi:hypothetical protein